MTEETFNDPTSTIGVTDATSLLKRGLIQLNAQQFKDAVADLSQAIGFDLQIRGAHFARGVAHYSLGEFECAQADFSREIEVAADDPRAFAWRADIFIRHEKFKEAIADLDAAIRLKPDVAVWYEHRGLALQRTDCHEQALADFSTAIQLEPESSSAHLRRATSYQELGEFDEAFSDYTTAIRLDSSNATALWYRGRMRQSRYDELEQAIDDFTQAISLQPENAELICDRGEAWAEREEHEIAIADFTQAIRLHPENSAAYFGRAQSWLDAEYHENAIADLKKAIQLDSQDSEKHKVLGNALSELGHQEEADQAFETANQLDLKKDEMMLTNKTHVYSLLQSHFNPLPLDQLTITERRFPGRVRADLQLALDSIFNAMSVRHFCGVRKQYCQQGVDFTDLLVRNRHDPALSVPPQYEEINVGESQPVRCIKEGLWLLEDEETRLAVFLEPAPYYHRAFGIRFQVAVPNSELGSQITQKFFRHLETSVREARCYRGKILSLEQGDQYEGTSTGITVHKLQHVARDQVILPRRTVDLLDRNVIQFVRQRPRLAEMGLATKKGLLFYGPPGTGKTHTIHYLAAALEGMTTLLISAEQVGLLTEYMTLARLLQPSIVVIEDADLIARERTQMSSACEEVLLNKLLNEMDGLRESADILFILTTNRPEALEAALASRPGRIDQAIEFPLPDEEGRAKLVRLYCRAIQVSDKVVHDIARKTENVSAAFIKELMRRAAQFQLERNGSDELTIGDVDNALEELLFSGGSLNRKLLGGKIGESVEA